MSFWTNLRNFGNSRKDLNAFNYQYLIDKPAWLSLSTATDYRKAAEENPVVSGCLSILCKAAANGKKYLVDTSGNDVSWDSKTAAVQKAKKLFTQRPNPLQSPIEFDTERYYMRFVFGNNYVYMNNPLTQKSNILNVQTLYNLQSEFVEIKQTGKLYDQTELSGIIEKYCLTNYNPVRYIDSNKIILFNELNTSGIGTSIIGTSRLHALKWAINNTQLAFEAMNVILKSRGFQGILKTSNKDKDGTMIPVNPNMKKEIDETFKTKYGLGENQNRLLITYADVEFIKTIMSSEELGIYNEFANNAMIISNGLGVPPELYKTYMKGATYENQLQAVRRLYQDTVIPMVANDDQYWSEQLLSEFGLEIRTDWSHISALQEAYKEKAAALNMSVSAAEKVYNNNAITWNQYLEIIDLPPVVGGDVYKFERDKKTQSNEQKTE